MGTQIVVRLGHEENLQISWLSFTHSFSFPSLGEALIHIGQTLAVFNKQECTPALEDCCKKADISFNYCPQCGGNLKRGYQENVKDLQALIQEFGWISSNSTRIHILEEVLEDAGWSLREKPNPDCYVVPQDADEIIAYLGLGLPLRKDLEELLEQPEIKKA